MSQPPDPQVPPKPKPNLRAEVTKKEQKLKLQREVEKKTAREQTEQRLAAAAQKSAKEIEQDAELAQREKDYQRQIALDQRLEALQQTALAEGIAAESFEDMAARLIKESLQSPEEEWETITHKN